MTNTLQQVRELIENKADFTPDSDFLHGYQHGLETAIDIIDSLPEPPKSEWISVEQAFLSGRKVSSYKSKGTLINSNWLDDYHDFDFETFEDYRKSLPPSP